MLVVLQFPLGDARPLAPSPRLPVPDWPTPSTSYPQDFVRGFGAVVRRRRGADAAWADELFFCQANRAVRFPDGTPPLTIDSGRFILQPAFRRLFVSGQVSARVEIGVNVASPSRDHPTNGDDATVLALLDGVVRLQTTCGANRRSLFLQGPTLSRHYAESTTPHPRDGVSDLVGYGAPAIFVEFAWPDREELPQFAQRIDPDPVPGVRVAFAYQNVQGSVIPIWFVYAADPRATRSLRICLMRLHAETVALGLVLRWLKRESLAYTPRTSNGDALERYLRNASRYVGAQRWGPVAGSMIQHALKAGQLTSDASEVELVRDRLQLARRQIRERVAEAELQLNAIRRTDVVHLATGPETTIVVSQAEISQSISINGDNYGDLGQEVASGAPAASNHGNGSGDGESEGGAAMGTSQHVNIGGSNYGDIVQVAAEKVENSFNAAKERVGNDPAKAELDAALDALKAEMKQLLADMESKQAGDPGKVAEAGDELAKEASREEPLGDVLKRAGKGIIDAAKEIAERVEPITSAVGRVLKFFGVALI